MPALQPAGPGDRPETAVLAPAPPPPDRPGPVLLVAGAVALVVVLLAGVAIGVVIGRHSTPTAGPAAAPPGPASYSTDTVRDACALVDTAPLIRWASAPRRAPTHEEVREPTGQGYDTLDCRVYYGHSISAGSPTNTADLWIRVETTDGTTVDDLAARKVVDARLLGESELADLTSGESTGIGTYSYWRHAADKHGPSIDDEYLFDVLDGNLSVLVVLSRTGPPESRVGRTEFDAVARSQVQRILDSLRRK
ncbi:hypothetical protein [Nocardia sp. NPDC051833]|uniref:hypothetical protein n=1 Tax=Nocardia sp. NPDC051833 TaxID=3155674 RepID=UPI0034329C0C